jgi:hypothetical protein
MVGNIVMSNTKGIRFDQCEFAHLGANGVDFLHGAHDNMISDCLFRDISAAAIQIGRTDGLTQTLSDPAAQEIGNTVSNSFIVQPAVEYHGSVVSTLTFADLLLHAWHEQGLIDRFGVCACQGISVGYTIGTNLSHNDIGNCTCEPHILTYQARPRDISPCRFLAAPVLRTWYYDLISANDALLAA